MVLYLIASPLWQFRDQLWSRREPNGTHRQIGKTWYEISRFHPERYVGLSIGMASVATHNQLALLQGNLFCKQSAPVIKLKETLSEETYTSLIGLLNSSTACFWMKQVSHCKGSTVDQKGARQTTVRFEDFYDYDATKIKQFPLPEGDTTELAKKLYQLAIKLNNLSPAKNASVDRLSWRNTIAQMVAFQEELDWQCYKLYRLIDEDFTHPAPLRSPLVNVPLKSLWLGKWQRVNYKQPGLSATTPHPLLSYRANGQTTTNNWCSDALN